MNALLWIFAIGAVLVGLIFLFAGVLAFLHSGIREERRAQLTSYITQSGSQIYHSNALEAQENRRAAMHITTGDLIRDEALVAAAIAGVQERRKQEETEQRTTSQVSKATTTS